MPIDSYLSHFRLNDDPFRTSPDPDYYCPLQAHANTLLSFEYTMNNREGFCLLTGEPGTGKTTLINLFLQQWHHQAEIALIMTPRLGPEEFLQALLQDLDVIYPLSHNKNDMIKEFRDFLLEHAARGRRVIIIVDEAQQLPDDTFEELRLLSNLETSKGKLLQIFMVGQPELVERLRTPPFRQINQRISVRVSLAPLNYEHTAFYLSNRLFQAGSQQPFEHTFASGAIKQIHKRSRGIPRLINLVASRALMICYLERSPKVIAQHVTLAADEVLLRETEAHPSYLSWTRIVLNAFGLRHKRLK